jgi:hypothetical protein
MKSSFVKNASDELQVKEASLKEKDKSKRDVQAVITVMASPLGRAFVWRLITEFCHYDAQDAQHSGSFTYFSLGEREVARKIKDSIYRACPEAYQLMERENWEIFKDE